MAAFGFSRSAGGRAPAGGRLAGLYISALY